MSTELNPALESMQREKRTVALNSLLAAIAITFLKLIVGLSTGSLGILSEAAHSGLDLVAALVTLLSVRVSDKPADAEHQYGHGKVENFSAFIETTLLLLRVHLDRMGSGAASFRASQRTYRAFTGGVCRDVLFHGG